MDCGIRWIRRWYDLGKNVAGYGVVAIVLVVVLVLVIEKAEFSRTRTGTRTRTNLPQGTSVESATVPAFSRQPRWAALLDRNGAGCELWVAGSGAVEIVLVVVLVLVIEKAEFSRTRTNLPRDKG